MKAITLAMLVPAALVLWGSSAAAQERDPAFNVPGATQHIVLNRGGGVIISEAINPQDPANADLIQTRLAQAAMTGLPELRALGGSVKYTFESTWNGAQIRIRTEDPAALNAIHDFLRFKIRELDTGDSDVVN